MTYSVVHTKYVEKSLFQSQKGGMPTTTFVKMHTALTKIPYEKMHLLYSNKENLALKKILVCNVELLVIIVCNLLYSLMFETLIFFQEEGHHIA